MNHLSNQSIKDFANINEILESAPIGIIIFDEKWNVIFINQNFSLFQNFRKFNLDDYLGKNFFETQLFGEFDLLPALKGLIDGESFEKEFDRYKKIDGGEISVIVKGSPIFKDNTFHGGILILEDLRITSDLKGAETLNSVFFNDFLRAISDQYLFTGPDGYIKKSILSDSQNKFGLNFHSEVQNLNEIFSDGNAVSSLFKEMQDSGSPVNGIILQTTGEQEVTLRVSLIPLHTERAKVHSVVVLLKDVSQELKESKDLNPERIRYQGRFERIVENMGEYVCTLDLEGNFTYVNQHFIQTFDYTEDEFLKMNLENLIDIDNLKSAGFSIDEISGSESKPLELILLKKNGEKVLVSAGLNSVLDEKGEVEYFNAVFTDITEKKKVDRDLLMIRSVFDASQDGIVMHAGEKCILANDSFIKMFGYSNYDEIYQKDILEFVADEDKPRLEKYHKLPQKNAKSPMRYEFVGKKKDDSTFNVERSFLTFETGGDKFEVSVFRDISEQKESLIALQELEERYRSITENINEFLWAAERKENKFLTKFYTASVKNVTGYDDSEFINDSKLWYKIIHPNDLSNVITKLKRFFRDTARASVDLEYRIQSKFGGIVWIQNKINVVRDDDGVIQKVYGLVNNISSFKKYEDELKHSADNLQRLNETKDRFISVISHDLRTPFSSILGFTDLLLSEKQIPPEKQREYISYIQEASKNMLSLVNSLLDWTRLQTGTVRFEPEKLNVRSLVTKSVQMLSGIAMQKKITLFPDINDNVFVHADEGLLFQVFNNLISNAIKFTPRHGEIKISARPLFQEKQIEFCVQDSGVGIKKDDVQKLFKIDLKYTTPGTAGEKGSGLGLSLCYDIVLKHGGDMRVESEEGNGSKFYFSLPVSPTTILLVDDVNTDRILYSKLLKSIIPDYKIIEAANGKEAFDTVRLSPPALIITDHTMPLMSGIDLVKKLNESNLNYKPPVIVLSNEVNDKLEEDYIQLGVEYVFKKPVNLSTFKFAIEKSLKKAVFI